jgi:hypothetical protein
VVRVPGYRYNGPGFDSRRYQIFWEVVGLERGPLSLVSTTEELLGRNSSGSGSRKPTLTAVEIRCFEHTTPSIRKKLALTSPTSGGHSVDIVRFRTKATENYFNTYEFLRMLTPWHIYIEAGNKKLARSLNICGLARKAINFTEVIISDILFALRWI